MPEDSVAIRIMLRGASEAAAGAKAVGQSIEGLGAKAKTAGSRMTSSFEAAGSQLGYLKYAATAALGTLGALSIKSGLQFNASMESNTVAFKHFLGSAGAANAEVRKLFEIAAKTPFEFGDIATATRRFLAFGFSVKDANRELSIVGDAIAGMGGGAQEINQLVLALGQIKAKGRLQGNELLQLTSLGIIGPQDIAKQLKMEPGAFDKAVSANQVPSSKAIPAINAILQRRFAGSSAEQGKTFSGQFSTLKDYTSRGLGQLTMPLFNELRDKVFPGLNKALASGAPLKALRSGFASVKKPVMEFLDAIRPAAPFFQNVLWPLIKGIAEGIAGGLVGAFKVLIPVVRVIANVLGWLGKAARPLRGVFEGIGKIIGFVFGGPILKGIALVGKLGFGLGFLGRVVRTLALPFTFMTHLIGRLGAAFAALATIAGGAFTGIKGTVVSVLNFLIRQVNHVLGALNGLHVHTPFGDVGVPHIDPIGLIGSKPARPSGGGGFGGGGTFVPPIVVQPGRTVVHVAGREVAHADTQFKARTKARK